MEISEKERILYIQIKEELSLRLEQLEKINPNNSESIFIKYKELQDDDKIFLFTHSIPIIYSLWEGYVVKVLDYYVEYINKLKIPKFDFIDTILIYCAEYSDLKIQNYPQKQKTKTEYFEKLKVFIENQTIEIPTKINTKDNLGFSVINSLLSTFGLEEFKEIEVLNHIPEEIRDFFFSYLPQNTNKYPIASELGGGKEKTSLLKMRNDISHKGIYEIENKELYVKRFAFLVIFLMESIFEKIKFGVENKAYLKK